jgi:hypothetical protein
LPDAWASWGIWQYGSTGTVPGISGDVDVDRFNGTLDDLKKLAGAAPYAAEYVAQSFPLASKGMTMVALATLPAYIELKNIGTKTWDANTRLATSQPRERASSFAAADWLSPTRPAAVQGMVPPGSTYRFQFTLDAPSVPGHYAEYFDVVEEGVAWFSDPGQGGPPDDQLQNAITVVPGIADAGVDAASDGATGRAGAGSDAGPELADAGRGMGTDGPPATVPDGGRSGADGATLLDAAASSDGGCACRFGSPRSRTPMNTLLGLLGIACGLRRRRLHASDRRDLRASKGQGCPISRQSPDPIRSA